jgi:predicted phosphodiesterase
MVKRSTIVAGLLLICGPTFLVAQEELTLPNRDKSIKFAVLGDPGTGGREQYEVGNELWRFYQAFQFTFVIMTGDNIYGAERPQDFVQKFERPYKPLLDSKVEFYATLGNHDDPNQRFYKPFNMDGKRYRSYAKGNVKFLVLDSNYMDPDQVKWVEDELKNTGNEWKIPYFHHPLYTTARRGPEVELREILEPLFVKYGVEVVFSGHEHVYERIKPQKGIYYFTVGGSAKLRSGDVRPGDLTQVGFAADRSFMLVEVAGDSLYFQAISRTGKTIDKGVIGRKPKPAVKPPVAAK